MSEIDSQQLQPNSEPNADGDLLETPPSPPVAVEPEVPPAPTVYIETDDVPEWAVGKTAAEVITLTGNLMDAMKTYEPPTQQAAPAVQQPAVPVTPVAGPQIPNPSLSYDDPGAYASQMQAFLDQRDKDLQEKLGQQLSSYMAPFSQTVGSLARQQVATNPAYKTVFDKWGHEIDQELAANQVGIGNRTPKTYQIMADIIKGRHVDELAQDEANRILSAGGHATTVRGGVGGNIVPAAPVGDALDQAWAEGEIPLIKGMQAQGLTKEDARRAIDLQGHTVDKWLTIASGGNVFVSPDGTKSRTQLHSPGGNS